MPKIVFYQGSKYAFEQFYNGEQITANTSVVMQYISKKKVVYQFILSNAQMNLLNGYRVSENSTAVDGWNIGVVFNQKSKKHRQDLDLFRVNDLLKKTQKPLLVKDSKIIESIIDSGLKLNDDCIQDLNGYTDFNDPEISKILNNYLNNVPKELAKIFLKKDELHKYEEKFSELSYIEQKCAWMGLAYLHFR